MQTPRIFSRLFRKCTWSFNFSKHVFLSFDDGPDPKVTPWILAFLKTHNLKACFFCVGENVKKYPELFQEIKKAGHVIGNHAMKHENGWKTNTIDYLKSVNETCDLVNSSLFRPPYGKLTPQQYNRISKKHRIVMWSWIANDFNQLPIDTILKSAHKKIKQGSILVFHDNEKHAAKMKQLLPEIREIVEAKKLDFGDWKDVI